MTAEQVNYDLKLFSSTLKVDKINLKNNADKKINSEKIINKIIKKIYDELIDYFKKETPDWSDELIKDFINIYIEFSCDIDYKIETMQYILTVKPSWRKFNDINFNDVEKLDIKLRQGGLY